MEIESCIEKLFEIFRRRSVAVLILLGVFLYVLAPPLYAMRNAFVSVREGATLRDIARDLEEARVVAHPLVFEWIVRLRGDAKAVQAGEYAFSEPLGAFEVARRLAMGDFGLEQISIRIPEGATRRDIAALFDETFPLFDERRFLALTEGSEGYLFPDTYFFLPNTTADAVADRLSGTFSLRLGDIEKEIVRFGKPLHEIVTMASLIEKEVHRPSDRRTVSGILWKRIELGMPLQVDAPFVFLFGKASRELTAEDLEFDSPYNTYLYTGLPPGPIGNPSLDALRAAVLPVETEYLFYLSDDDGVTRYARNFEEHKRNKERYLE